MAEILIIAAHPDDEILGSGGTIRRFIKEGKEAQCLILTGGVTGRYDKPDEADPAIQVQVKQLRKQAEAASQIIGFRQTELCNLPDNRLEELPFLDIIKLIERKLGEVKPSIIFTHHYGDLNIDHRIAFEAVMTAARPVGEYPTAEIYCFETFSSTEWEFTYNKSFKPNVFFNIEDTFRDKAEAMKCYTSELREYPHPRSIEALEAAAMRWGTVVGCKMAEAFELIRKVVK